jgi:hypothetical protein
MMQSSIYFRECDGQCVIYWPSTIPQVFVALIFIRHHVEPHQEDAQEDQLRRLFQALVEFGVLPG